ncbi:MAG: YjbQ family protein [Candidatus Omnitrophica bacterium]|nr:YjbQ family protein [Candidatus Omnitrophota bacterium]
MIATYTEELRTNGQDDCVDITETVQQAVSRGKIRQGLATVFVTGSEDLRYAHHEAAGDDNGFSHLRASFIGPSLTIPIVDGRLQLGTWQQIVLIDFDVHPRTRSYLIHLLGE